MHQQLETVCAQSISAQDEGTRQIEPGNRAHQSVDTRWLGGQFSDQEKRNPCDLFHFAPLAMRRRRLRFFACLFSGTVEMVLVVSIFSLFYAWMIHPREILLSRGKVSSSRFLRKKDATHDV